MCIRPSSMTIQTLLYKQAIHHIEWKYSPAGAPHFGGLWKVGMKTMKLLLRKNVGSQPLPFKELTTILAVSESVLVASQSLPTDGDMMLTPGHFLIGRPLQVPLFTTFGDSWISLPKRWRLVNQLAQDLGLMVKHRLRDVASSLQMDQTI